MPLYKVDALVLRLYTLGEADRIAVLFSENNGKVRAVAHSARKPKSKLGGSIQPLNHVQLSLYSGHSLDTISQCQLVDSFPRLHSDLAALTHGLYMAEIVDRLTIEDQSMPDLYLLFVSVLHLLDEGLNPAEILPYFETRALSVTGSAPKLDVCARCGRPLGEQDVWWSPADGGAICEICDRDVQAPRMRMGDLAVIRYYLTRSPAEFLRLRPSAGQISAVCRHLENFLTYVFGAPLKGQGLLDEIRRA
jgi:DNA repair protein RecO (recombination protein O)